MGDTFLFCRWTHSPIITQSLTSCIVKHSCNARSCVFMINVAGHLREQNGTYQMILSWKDTNGKHRTKSISTGLPIKGNKKTGRSPAASDAKGIQPGNNAAGLWPSCIGVFHPLAKVWWAFLPKPMADMPMIWAKSSCHTLKRSNCPWKLSLRAIWKHFSATNASKRKQPALCQWCKPERDSGMARPQWHQHHKQHLYTSGFLQQGVFCQCHRQHFPRKHKI